MIELESIPELTNPVVIAAFEGWNDAGDAASTAIEHLEDIWQATQIAAFDPEDYYDFQVNRPIASMDETGTRRLIWPTTRISIAHSIVAGRDIILIRGIEPNLRWRSFSSELLAIAQDLGAELIITLGALLADVPHTRPVPISATTGEASVARTYNIEVSRHEGPTGIIGVIQDMCRKLEIPAISLWAAVPHYVSQPPCPKAALALLHKIEDILELSITLGDLPEDARAWERGVNELAEEDSEVAHYVRSLEEARDTAELPEASGEAIAHEFERYLRRRDNTNDQKHDE